MSSDPFRHRKSAVTINIKHNGSVLANRPVSVKQIKHAFLFGVGGFDALWLVGENPDGGPIDADFKASLEQRLDTVFSVMNYATLPFYLGRYEPVEGHPDSEHTLAAARYYRERGVQTKGHPLVWHTVCADWLMRYSNTEILEKLRQRVRREVSQFSGVIDMWDVLNEAVIMPIFDKYDNAVTRVCKEIGRVSLIREVFTEARKANPKATLLLNDFDLSTRYDILIDGCLQSGVPIDVIGIQSHQHQGYWGAEKTREILERYAQFGLPLHFTENTILSGDLMPPNIVDLNDWQVDAWPSTSEGEERQMREIIEMYSILFAHPLVEAITTWDMTDGKWLKAPSGLLREDNSIKPAFAELEKKINGEWRTQTALVSNAAGEVSFEGFRGDYEIECNGKKTVFTLAKDTPTLTVNM